MTTSCDTLASWKQSSKPYSPLARKSPVPHSSQSPLVTELKTKSAKLTVDFEKLQVAFNQGIKGCNDRIEQKKKVKFEDFKLQLQYELEQIKSKPFAVPRLGRAASAPCLAHPNKLNDPTFFDPSIVRLNSQGIVGLENNCFIMNLQDFTYHNNMNDLTGSWESLIP